MGISGDIGRHVAPALSVAFEFSIPARFTSMQHVNDRGLVEEVRIENRYRDIVLSGLLHFHTLRTGRAQFALVGGPSLVREDTLIRESHRPFFPPGSAFGPYGVASQQTRWTFGISGGGDVAVAVNRRVSVVPQIRVHVVSRDSALAGTHSGNLALGSFVIRPGVNVRLAF
jgi:hypothetical protein